jgi:hypothetical protein
VSAIAGWYTDPSGVQGQLRWWDGARWTDHVTPDPAFVGSGPAPGGEQDPIADDQPASADEETGSGAEPAVPDGAQAASADPTTPGPQPSGAAPAVSTAAAPASTPQSTSGVIPPATSEGIPPPPPGAPPAPAWGPGGGRDDAPTWLPAEPRSGKAVRTGLIVAAVVAVLLLGLVGFAFVGLFAGLSSDGDFSFEFGDTDRPSAADGEVVSGGAVAVGDTRLGLVPSGGSFELDLLIDEATEVTVDVRARGGLDATLEILDASGGPRGFNDDRGSAAGGDGADSLDPYLEVDLEPGTYRIVVGGFGGDSGEVEVRIR